MRKVDNITQKRLKKVLKYNKYTGFFTWRERISGRAGSGDTAGCITHKGYRIIGIDKVSYRANRLAFLYMTGSIPDEIDHINKIKDDNSWENLRSITHSNNNKNRNRLKNNTSGITGVYFQKSRNKWKAFIVSDNIYFYLGAFISKHDAIIARYNAEIEHSWNSSNKDTDAKKYVDKCNSKKNNGRQ